MFFLFSHNLEFQIPYALWPVSLTRSEHISVLKKKKNEAVTHLTANASVPNGHK